MPIGHLQIHLIIQGSLVSKSHQSIKMTRFSLYVHEDGDEAT